MLSELDTKLPLCTMLILMILLVWGPMMVSKQLNVQWKEFKSMNRWLVLVGTIVQTVELQKT